VELAVQAVGVAEQQVGAQYEVELLVGEGQGGQGGRDVVVRVVCVLVWQALTAYFDDAYFPTPVEVVRKMHELWFSGPAHHLFLTTVAIEDILPSLGRLLAGWAIGGVIGIALGLSLVLTVIAELVGAANGIGYQFQLAGQS
jgi:ABC-type nitrate/sulfonate/bicarbonate transport system permease component